MVDSRDRRDSRSRHNPKSSSLVDRHIGSRVRTRRMVLGISQEELGRRAGGITFQQVQKYEKGANRIGASRLHQIAQVLQVPVEYFYEGAPGPDGGVDAPAGGGADFLATGDNLDLMKAFLRIQDQAVRRQIIQLTRAVADLRDPDGVRPPAGRMRRSPSTSGR